LKIETGIHNKGTKKKEVNHRDRRDHREREKGGREKEERVSEGAGTTVKSEKPKVNY
jgi:hypothetical protein